MEMIKEKCRVFRLIRKMIAEKNGIDCFVDELCEETGCRGLCDCDRYRMENYYLRLWLRQKLERNEPLAEVEFPKALFSGLGPEEKLLWGRQDWKPSVNACLSLMEAGVITIDEFQEVAFWRMEKNYELPEEDAKTLETLLNSLGYGCRRPRVRRCYDDFRPIR